MLHYREIKNEMDDIGSVVLGFLSAVSCAGFDYSSRVWPR